MIENQAIIALKENLDEIELHIVNEKQIIADLVDEKRKIIKALKALKAL